MNNRLLITICLSASLLACSTNNPGPDKTIAGAILGAGWGAGAGAVVGNQLTPSTQVGEGAAIGAGFGLVSGALQGAGYDVIEEEQVRQARKLQALEIQNLANGQELANIQGRLDDENSSALSSALTSNVYQVYFESDATNLKSGAIKNLETIADQIAASPRFSKIVVQGHTDDTGDKEYNNKLSTARAHNVADYLKGRGISQNQIQVSSFGAKQPIASNKTLEGRQLNRRVDVLIR